MTRALRDRYGMLFWLKWILWFAGSFIAAGLAWTALMRLVFGRIEGPELTITWTVAVFGCWFLLVIPFMRKKEQIWKRLNEDQERAVDAWFSGMSAFIGLLIISAFFWSIELKEEIMATPGMYGKWAKAVFGSWLVILIPFLILMYRKADKIFTKAVARQTYSPNYRKANIERHRRMLPPAIVQKLKTIKPALPNGHVVNATLKDGRKIPDVFIMRGNEILGIYDQWEMNFNGDDIVDVQPIPPNELPPYEEAKWLRLDIKT